MDEPGDFEAETPGMMAASACNSPSICKLGERSSTIR
jgi:hypothetical protein